MTFLFWTSRGYYNKNIKNRISKRQRSSAVRCKCRLGHLHYSLLPLPVSGDSCADPRSHYLYTLDSHGDILRLTVVPLNDRPFDEIRLVMIVFVLYYKNIIPFGSPLNRLKLKLILLKDWDLSKTNITSTPVQALDDLLEI